MSLTSGASGGSRTPPRPTPSAAPPGVNSDKTPIGFVHILVYDWAVGASEVRLKLPREAEPDQPNALSEQARFRRRLIADLDAAIGLLGDPNTNG